MKPTSRPRVKICCIASLQEARLAIEFGASAVGLVSAMPSGPGVIGEDLIAGIAAFIPPAVATFLLTSQQDADAIITQQRRTKANTLQIVDRLEPGTHRKLRGALPGIRLVQVIHITGDESIEEAMAVWPGVDALLLDSGNPSADVKELGGTGRAHNWSISAEIRSTVDVPVFLAGGLNPDNVQESIRQVCPWAVDVCGGVRTNGKLDRDKLSKFFSQVSTVDLNSGIERPSE